jgi:small subunit ribosomal protein S6
MRNYQLVLVLRKSLSEANRKKLLETIKGLLTGAKFTKVDEWGEKTLAYVIKKESSAFFVNVLFETKEELTKDFEKKLMATDDVIRHLLLRSK